MLSQVGGIGEGFGTVRTLVRFGLGVGFRVDLHLRLGEECERTYFTPGTWEEKRRCELQDKITFAMSKFQTVAEAVETACLD